MIRKLPLAIALALASAPWSAHALGLGEIRTNSALNQRFNAEIDLLSVIPGEIGDVKVELASPEVFARAGVERPFLLSVLRFSPEILPDGSTVIRVSSREPVREPFLNFLIEVNWPKGRMIREYTVLLDPPVTLGRRTAPIAPAQVEARPAGSRPLAPPAARSAVAESGPMREYGPTRPNDTLWEIAQTMREDGETVQQIIVALHDRNPDAFIRGDINRLKVGQVLHLPLPGETDLLTPRQARDEFAARMAGWREARDAEAAVSRAPAIEAERQPTKAPAGAAEAPELRLAAAEQPAAEDEVPAAEGSAQEGAELARLRSELLLVREENASVRQESDELRSRMQDMESRLQDIQRLLTLKSDELAKLQAGAAAPAAVDPPSTPDADAGPAAAEPAVAAEPAAMVAPAEEPAPEPAAGDGPPPDAGPVVAANAPVPPAQPTPVAATSPSLPQPGSPIVPGLGNNGVLYGIGGAVVATLGLLGWVMMRRRREAEEEFAESILVAPSDGVDARLDVPASTDAPVGASADETSFLSDFSPSDIDALQDETGEVDPVSEADVYIAYGRYQQAEDLIRQAIEKNPERTELKIKLLEIFFSNKDLASFGRMVEELQAEGVDRADPDAWQGVVAMGRELAPDDSTFHTDADRPATPARAAGAAGVAGVAGAAGSKADDDLDFDLLGPQGDLTDSEIISLSDEGDVGLTLDDLEADISELQSRKSAASAKVEEDEPIALPEEDEMSGLTGTEDDEALRDLDGMTELNLELDALGDLSESELHDENESEISFSELESELSRPPEGVDLGELEFPTPDSEINRGERASPGEDGAAAGQAPQPSGDESGFGDSILLDEATEEDEINTKLDLARAYAEMGDGEGARHILNEVMNEGTEDQRQEAARLLEGLGG